MEISLYPWMWIVDDALQRIDLHVSVDDDPDTIAGTEDTVQIVRDHNHGQAKLLLEIQHQLVEFGCADGIEP